jgi:hypothetical protein
MRAAIVEREDMPAIVHQKNISSRVPARTKYWAMAAVHNESPFGLIHGKLIRQAVRGNAIQQGPFPICQSSLRCTSSADQS